MPKFYILRLNNFQKGSTNGIQTTEIIMHCNYPISVTSHCILISQKRIQCLGEPILTLVTDFFPLFPLFLHFFSFHFALFPFYYFAQTLHCHVQYTKGHFHTFHIFIWLLHSPVLRATTTTNSAQTNKK